jgi:hypothetical protein
MRSGASVANKQRLIAWKDRHAGERCIVVANGPSLLRTDLSLLAGEVTFGMNRIYRMEADNGFRATYLVVIDLDSQLEQIAPELRAVHIPKFLNWNARNLTRDVPDVTYLKATFQPRFSTDLLWGLWGGHSVTYVCLQLAYWMGFRDVILIGKDHDYRQHGFPGQVVTADGSEANHALGSYYAKGQTWRVPDYKGEELAYRMARAAFERDGRRVRDATVGGKLTVFEKVELREVLADRRGRR